MNHLAAKILVMLACSVIMLHAFVPHHHHDSEAGGGLIFETELGCHCDADGHDHSCHHSHSHHPFDFCLLQEMLSHLVLSTNDDQFSLSNLIAAESNNYLLLDLLDTQWVSSMGFLAFLPFRWPPNEVPLSAAPMLGATSLRAPPIWE